jgi:putative two-component system response regulator
VATEGTLLVVDDEPVNLTVLTDLLRPTYDVRVANSGAAALRAARTPPRPDLILLDVMMPGMDGFTVLERLRADAATADVPVLFVTALDDAVSEERGLAAGAADFVTKPIRPAVVRARVRAHLRVKRMQEALHDRNRTLEAEVVRRVADMTAAQHAGIQALAHVAETRDTDTGLHIFRTQRFVEELAHRLHDHPRFSEHLTASTIDLIVRSAPLHDLGKVGIPDRILLKPGPLNEEEWAVMKTHTVLGAEALAGAEADVDRPVPFLPIARTIARSHHERWDGSGYPDGLVGDEIPVPARLMALADVFDALISKRVYKEASGLDEAAEEIRASAGRHFDPDVVAAFERGFDAFVSIAES